MATQPKNNIGNVMIITPNRERSKTTTHPFIRADNSINKTANSIEKLLTNYWGSPSEAQYKPFLIDDDITKYCPKSPTSGHGMATFRVDESDIIARIIDNIAIEPFNESNLNEFLGNTTYRFVLEGYYIWLQVDSEYAADGFGHIVDEDGPATHLLATFGQENRGGEVWYYLILQAGNIKQGEPNIIKDYTGGGSVPPGSGTPIPPPEPGG